MENKIIMYTNKTCGYCKQTKERFNKENIKFVEKTNDDFAGEWYKVNYLTGLPIFPTMLINGNYLVPQRDFQNIEQLVNIIDYITGPEYPNYTQEEMLMEKVKTLNYVINSGFMQINQRLNKLENKE